jgi:hypothetical protein
MLHLIKTDRLCLRTIIGGALLIAASPYTTGCLPALADDPPVMAYELDGTWCTFALPVQTCLTVRSAQSTGLPTARYWFTQPTCQETGDLTGGLEFSPDTASRLCIAPDPYLYGARAEWTASGLSLEVDPSPSTNETILLDMHYVSYQENENVKH